MELTADTLKKLIMNGPGLNAGRLRTPPEKLPEYFEDRKVEDISPLRAMELLAATWAKYPNGRNFYPTRIEKIKAYADKMRSGTWIYDPEFDPIVVTDGMVTGGRHRLHAILLAHTTVKSNILYRKLKET